MPDRICSLCGQGYTDEKGHNYDDCVRRISDSVANLEGLLYLARKHLKEARKVQAHDWWKAKAGVK